MRRKFGKFFWIGFFIGLIVPFAIIMYSRAKLANNNLNIKETIQYLFYNPDKSTVSKLISLSLLANGIGFAVCVQFDKYEFATGLFTSTMLWGVLAVVTKFFL